MTKVSNNSCLTTKNLTLHGPSLHQNYIHYLDCHREVTEQGHRQQRLDKNADSTHHNDAWHRTQSLSSGAAQSNGTTIISDNARLEKGNVNFPLRRDGQLFTLDLELLPMQTSTSAPSALIATNKADTWHRRLGHPNESSIKTLRDQPDSGVSFEGNNSPCETRALGKSAQGKHPKTSTVTTTTAFELVYTDLAGSFKPNAMDGSRYISKSTDHHTRWKRSTPFDRRMRRSTPSRTSFKITPYLLG